MTTETEQPRAAPASRDPGEVAPRSRTVEVVTRVVGALAAAVVAYIHFTLAGEYLQRETYVGVGFIVGALALTYTAVQLARRFDLVAWGVGALTAAGMMAAYVLARTTGLPSNFSEVLVGTDGIVSLLAEGLLVVTSLVAVLLHRRRDRAAPVSE